VPRARLLHDGPPLGLLASVSPPCAHATPQSGIEQVALGLYLVRGDNMCVLQHAARALPLVRVLNSACSAVVGELDEDLDANLDLSSIRAPPLKSISN
jgi:hypothetical protein